MSDTKWEISPFDRTVLLYEWKCPKCENIVTSNHKPPENKICILCKLDLRDDKNRRRK